MFHIPLPVIQVLISLLLTTECYFRAVALPSEPSQKYVKKRASIEPLIPMFQLQLVPTAKHVPSITDSCLVVLWWHCQSPVVVVERYKQLLQTHSSGYGAPSRMLHLPLPVIQVSHSASYRSYNVFLIAVSCPTTMYNSSCFFPSPVLLHSAA